MASSLPPVRGAAFTCYASVVSQADTDVYKTSVTLAAGDVTVSKDGGSFSNIATLPTEIGTTGVLAVALSATEMTADVIVVRLHDAAGDEWQDALISIYTAAQTFDALATAIGDVATVLPSAAPGTANGLFIIGSNVGRSLFQGQISLLANEDGEGALHIVNSSANGIGIRVMATETGGTGISMLTDAGDIVGNLVGTVNGLTATAQADVRTAVGLAAANLDTQLSSAAGVLTAIKGAGWTDETLVALDVLLDAIKAKTDLLTAGNITMVSPVTVSGDVTIDQGYDYYTADGRGLSWTDETPATWPDLSGATATLRVGGLAITGAITNPTGPATITVELSSLQTASLAVGVHRFKIDVTLANTHLILQVRGDMIVS